MDEIEKLIARLRQARGHDPVLDAQIHNALADEKLGQYTFTGFVRRRVDVDAERRAVVALCA